MKIFLLLLLFLTLGCEKLNELFLEEDLLQRPPSKRCGDCHARIYEDWKKSRHFHAWVSEEFKEESENYSKLKCLSCHAPHQVDPLKEPLLRVERRHEGVNCIACHFKEETKAMHGPYKVWSPPHPSKEDKNYTKSEMCAGCHQKTYKEWKLTRVKTSCQQCHMKVVDYTWIMDKFPFYFFHSRKALHDHTFPAGKAKPKDLKIIFRDGKLSIVNVGIPHNLPTADQGNPKLYIFVEIFYDDGKKRVIRKVLSAQAKTALRYLEPYFIKIPNHKKAKKIVIHIYRKLSWQKEKEIILVDEVVLH
ncbi:MAG TPA: hypothetical protein EYP32_06460 [Aquificaceae bacterium]|nr:hypothetical protein [Aquificaceae bacterium]HIQ49507.1 hypothetical protein [Aquifex aeolicus]